MTLGDRIKLIRGDLSREKFSPLTGISKTTLVNYETGVSSPTAEYLNKILLIFPDINPTWLLTGEEEMMQAGKEEKPGGEGKEAIKKENEVVLSEQLLSDEELICLIYEAVDEVAAEWGNDESILSSKEKALIAKELFIIFSKKENRQWVTKETMAEQAVTLYLFSCNRDKVAHLISKLGITPSDKAFHILSEFMVQKEFIDVSLQSEGKNEGDK